MILYWFWFLFPVGLGATLTAIERYRAERNGAEPKFALAFFFFTGMPAFIPGWVALYSQVVAALKSIVIPADQVGTLIAEFTMAAVALTMLVLHFLVVFVLMPAVLATALRNISSLRSVTENKYEK